MPTVRECYDEMLRGVIAPPLRAVAFRKRRNSFSRLSAAGWGLINFQASQFGTLDSVSFTINIGLAFAELSDVTAGPPTFGRADVRQRIGPLLNERQDKWWVLQPDSDFDAVAADVTAAVSGTVIPWLEERATLATVLAGVRADPNDFLATWHVKKLAVLLDRAGRAAEAHELREIVRHVGNG